jgi:hypothetical protein
LFGPINWENDMPINFTPYAGSGKSRADLLAEIAGLPLSAFIPTAHAAAYLGSSAGVMTNWRAQRRGPRYYGKNEFVRYRISDLDEWMSARAEESQDDESSTDIGLNESDKRNNGAMECRANG